VHQRDMDALATLYGRAVARVPAGDGALTAAQREGLARGFVSCPHVRKIIGAAHYKEGASMDFVDETISDTWMILETRYSSVLLDPEQTLAIASRCGTLIARGMRTRENKRAETVSLSALDGRAAERSDFAAFGDYGISQMEEGTREDEATNGWRGIALFPEAEIAQRQARELLASRFATLPRPSGVRRSVRDDDPARPSSARKGPCDAQSVAIDVRLNRLAAVTGINKRDLNGILGWSEQSWNDVMSRRGAERYSKGQLAALRRRDLALLAMQERSHIGPLEKEALRAAERNDAPALLALYSAAIAPNLDPTSREAAKQVAAALGSTTDFFRWHSRPNSLRLRFTAHLLFMRWKSSSAKAVSKK